jgi:hypothetical protein
MKRLFAHLVCSPLYIILCIFGLFLLIIAGIPRVILNFLVYQQSIARGEIKTFREVWDPNWNESNTKLGFDMFLHPIKFWTTGCDHKMTCKLYRGNIVTTKGVSLGCITRCTIIGITEDNQLILKGDQGPKLNDGELVPVNDPRFIEIQNQPVASESYSLTKMAL